MNPNIIKYYQVSTLQALALGFSKSVITVGELLRHGDMWLGTFEDVDGEMIVLGGKATVPKTTAIQLLRKMKGVYPLRLFANFALNEQKISGKWITLRIEEDFGLNLMYAVRIDGDFSNVDARSESGTQAHHLTLKDALSVTQKAFIFENIKGSPVCVYYSDYMDGINAAGWHMHFISEDKKNGDHVFDVSINQGQAAFCRITSLEIRIPDTPVFDTYALKGASKEEIKSVEQGKN